MANLTEKLAELEHEQWVSWSQSVASSEPISPERLEKWKSLWIPYSQLPESEKQKDREWAEKIFPILTIGIQDIFDEQAMQSYKRYGGKKPLLWRDGRKK